MWPEPSWETRVGNHPVLASIEVSSMDLKELKVCTVYSGISEQIKPLQLVGQEAESKFKPPCLSFGNHALRLFPKRIEGLDCKING